MGNEQSGLLDSAANSASADGLPNAPSTPRPILRNATSSGGQLGDEKSRRSVIFRDQTEDALRFNRSIVHGSASSGPASVTGLTRLSQQVNDLNGGLRQQTAVPELQQPNGQVKRTVRTQKPPAPAPPPSLNKQELSEDQGEVQPAAAAPAEDDRVARMREYVFALAERKEKRNQGGETDTTEGRLYDPSQPELPTVTEETEEREDSFRGGLKKADLTEALKAEIKQEILRDLLSQRSSSSGGSSQQATASAEAAAPDANLSEAEKNKLIAEIRQQLLGQQQPQEIADYPDGNIPEPDYSEDELTTTTSEQPPPQIARFASELAMNRAGTPNGNYRSPIQPRRFKGPAPAPPNSRYRRGGPPVVREPYQANWEEPIFAYDGPQNQKAEQRLQEQMEKAYDDRYRQKSRTKRFGDSWKRMTASLSKAFGFSNSGQVSSSGGGSGGGTGKSGVVRRSSVRDGNFERTSDSYGQQQQQQQAGFKGTRMGSAYSLASSESPMQPPARMPPHHRAPLTADIWRDVVQASHDQLLHTSNPVYGVEASSGSGSGSSSGAEAAAGTAPRESDSACQERSPIARVTVQPLNNKVNANREQTYL